MTTDDQRVGSKTNYITSKIKIKSKYEDETIKIFEIKSIPTTTTMEGVFYADENLKSLAGELGRVMWRRRQSKLLKVVAVLNGSGGLNGGSCTERGSQQRTAGSSAGGTILLFNFFLNHIYSGSGYIGLPESLEQAQPEFKLRRQKWAQAEPKLHKLVSKPVQILG